MTTKPLLLGVVLNPYHPAVSKFLEENGISLGSVHSGIVLGTIDAPEPEPVQAHLPATPATPATPPKSKRVKERVHAFDRKPPLDHASTILDIFDEDTALSAGEIEERTGLTRTQVKSGLSLLRDNFQIFKAGEKRYTRYALSQAVADAAVVDDEPAIQEYKPIQPARRPIKPEPGPMI